MNMISDQQFQNYEKRLHAIQEEYENSRKLKELINKEERKLVNLKLSTSPTVTCLAFTTVKVFSNLEDLYYLYGSDVSMIKSKSFQASDRTKFYLIEIKFHKVFKEKLFTSDAKVQVTIRTNTSYICKTFPMYDLFTIYEVIAVDAEVIDCAVDCCIFLSNDDCWQVIPLRTINIDLSYHLENYVKSINNTETLNDTMKGITKLYCPTFTKSFQDIVIENFLILNVSLVEVMRHLVKNAYHCLDLESIQKFSENKHQVTRLNLALNRKRITLSYYKSKNLVKITSDYRNMEPLVSFFLQFGVHNSYIMNKEYKTVNDTLSRESRELKELFKMCEECRKV